MTRVAPVAILACLLAGCADDTTIIDPPAAPGLDAQLRQELAIWGVVPIGPMPPQPAPLVALGQALMFDKVLSGNRDIACATCHHPSNFGADRLSLSIGTGGSGLGSARTLGAGRRLVPRNAPSLLGQGLRSQYIFWDGRVQGFASGPFTTPAGGLLPPAITNILVAQAMFPVTVREEMRGDPGDRDVFGNVNELAQFGDGQFVEIWAAVMSRLRAIPGYVSLFAAAFPTVPANALGFQHAAQALAAFEAEAFTRTDSPFDRYLARADFALSDPQKRGGILFFGRARCSSCHNGPLLGGSQFANDGVPQIGPGVGSAAPHDQGRGGVPEQQPGPFGPPPQFSKFFFRVPPLRNVELTAPYMHNGAYPTLEAVLRHYNDVPTALRTFDVNQLAPELRPLYRGDSATVNAVLATLDSRLRVPFNLSEAEREDLVAFLTSLTDPAARDLAALVPASVPSGLPVD